MVVLQIRRLGMGWDATGRYRAEWTTVAETHRRKATKTMLADLREYLRANEYDVRIVANPNPKGAP